MNNKLLYIMVFIIGFVFSNSAFAVMGQSAPPPGAFDGILIKFKAGVSQKRMNKAFKSAEVKQNLAFRSHLLKGLTRANVGRGNSLASTLKQLRKNKNVVFAEPNYILSAYIVPDDPDFALLWGLDNTGQTGGVGNADIDAPEAWNIATGNNVIVAVVDSGVDYNHEDLATNIWVNTGEIPNNGVDDDGNGFVDDVRGWDFFNGDNDPMDDNNHGTHIAGTIAANGNNGIGVVGVNWSARIMPLKFMDSAGAGTTADAIAAIDYAVANGAKVINASWGGGSFSTALFDAISAANDAGVLIVASSGNASANNDASPNYPSNYELPNVISVAATDDADTLAGFSNFGATMVDLGAPGVGIRSTILNNNYATFNGTSMAAPHVTGAAALVIANSPGISIANLRASLLSTTNAVADLAGRTVTGGRLNVFNALTGVAPVPVTVNVTPGNTNVAINNSVQFTASGGSTPYSWAVGNSTIGSVSATGNFTGLSAGSTNVTATDTNGVNSNNATVTVSANVTVSINPNTVNLNVGGTTTLTATGGSTPYSWASNNTTIATIGAASGVLTAQGAGTTTVTVTDNNGVAANSGTITVTAPTPVVVISVTPTVGNIVAGATLQFTATGGAAPYSWSVNNPSIASIGSTNGFLTGLLTGSVIVTARDVNNVAGLSGTVNITAGGMMGGMGGMGMGGGMMGGMGGM